MSGGSMNYLYSKLECGADFEENTPERFAFAKHLKLVAKALHDIEWVDSGDYGPGRDTDAIRACLGYLEPAGADVSSLAGRLREYESQRRAHPHIGAMLEDCGAAAKEIERLRSALLEIHDSPDGARIVAAEALRLKA